VKRWLIIALLAFAGTANADIVIPDGPVKVDPKDPFGENPPDAGPVKLEPLRPDKPEEIADPPKVREGDAQDAPASGTLAELRSRNVEQSLFGRLRGILGVLALFAIALLMSANRKVINWKLVAAGSALQLLFALLMLKTPAGEWFFRFTNTTVGKLLSFCDEGARFVFGNLVGLTTPVVDGSGNPTDLVAQTGSLIAFGVMPTILFFSALSAILYHLGVLQLVVKGIAFVMRYFMRISGAESLAAAANVFVGQTEAPLLVRPFLDRMTRSELMALMTGGFATVAGGVLAVYVGLLKDFFPDIAGHLVAASVMSAPASLVMAKIIVPETEEPETAGGAEFEVEKQDVNFLDAASRGTSEGLKLALNVAAMLVAFIALIAMANWLLSIPGEMFGVEDLTFQKLLGWILAPLAFLMGVPWEDAVQVGGMLGTKTVLNEFVAYLDLVGALSSNSLSHGKSVIIATYALCGFSNFASIGIQIGGLTVIAPTKRKELAQLGVRAMIAASLACFQTAAIAGMVL
jgi:CNT family concentrative nucleoside transporter